MYLKRKVYDKLLVWKEESDLTLEVTGARQVGKTYIINKFADENFICYYVSGIIIRLPHRKINILPYKKKWGWNAV